MTVSTINNKVNHTGDGVITVFPYAFPVLLASHMYVLIDDVQLSVGYTVNGVGDPAGGDVTFDDPPAKGVTVTLLRVVPETQEVDYKPYDPFPAETHEDALDKLTMLVQQLQEQVERTLIYPPSSSGSTSTQFPPYSQGNYIGWDEDEERLINYVPCQCPDPEPSGYRTMYGRVQGSDGAVLAQGGDIGFTIAKAGAVFTVNFASAINQDYVSVCSLAEDAFDFCRSFNHGTTSFQIRTFDEAGADSARDFSFHLDWETNSYKALNLLNPSFETGDLTNWTAEAGVPQTRLNADSGSIMPYEGTYFVGSETEFSDPWVIASDQVDLLAGGVDGAEIDNGLITVEGRWAQNAFNPSTTNDEGRGGLRFIAADGTTPVGSDLWGSYAIFRPWANRSFNAKVPATARYVQVLVNSKADVGDYPSAYFDAFALFWKRG